MTVVHAMLSNAAIAAVLTLVALAVGRWCRSPAVRHTAWVLVLLKLLTPPLLSVPLPVLPAAWAERVEDPLPGTGIILSPAPSAGTAPTVVAAGPPAAWARYRPVGVAGWAVCAWAAGAAVWFAWQGRRVLRFGRRVARAEEAPADIAAAARRLATALGIARPPQVKVTTGIGSPMLWGWGRGAVVLLPRDLLPRLSPEALDTLLAHELAHFLRRDHWVRVLEFAATGLYWWHPAVWLARTGLEAAEEECCDAWVVGGLAASPRLYAEALLATVDFEAELRRPRLPSGACGTSRSAWLLRRRLAGMINATRPRRLRVGTVGWVVLAALLLTRPLLRASAPEPTKVCRGPVASETERVCSPPARTGSPRAAAEPPAWATATAPASGLAVLARDREVLLRRSDGSTRELGPGRPLAVAFAPGGRRVAAVGPGVLVRTWDDRGEPLATARAAHPARALTYTPDGTRLLVLDGAGVVSVRDPETLEQIAHWSVGGPANSIACGPDGRTVAVAFGSWMADTGWVECWSVPERRRLARYEAPAPVGATRFSPDGRVLVIGGWNGLVIWREVPSGDLCAERRLSKDVVASAAFSPDAGTLPLEPPPEPLPPDGPEGPKSELLP